MYQFLLHFMDIRTSVITGRELFLGEILRLSSEDVLLSSEMLDRMVNYYMATYEMYNFCKLFGEGTDDSIIIHVKMNQFGRCQIGSEIFDSTISS